jgi:hypothetical protein
LFFLLSRGQFSPAVKLKKIGLWKKKGNKTFQDANTAFVAIKGNA